MPIRNGTYVPRSDGEIFTSQADELIAIEPTANPRSPTTYTYALLYSIARTIAQNQEQSLQNTYEAAYIQDADGENLTKKARNLGFIRKQATNATGVVEFSRENTATEDYVIPSGTVVETVSTEPVRFTTTESVTLVDGTSSVQATVKAVEAGARGNVGPNAIAAMPSPPIGVTAVTNPDPVGDPTRTDTNGTPLVVGRNRENDEQLRDRVVNSDATGKGPSPAGIRLALQETGDVISANLNTNQTNSESSDGLDPYHTEVVVYGGDVINIAQTLTEQMSVTTLLRLQGGVHGTKEETTLTIDLFSEDVTIPISRPAEDNLVMDVDVVHNANYEGTVAVKDAVVSYIGGTFADDSTTNGLLIGEDVRLNLVENAIEDIQGVSYANVTFVDGNGDGTDDSTTTDNGVPIYDVGDSSLARIDADEITISETSE